MKCPKCHGENMVKTGLAKGKQRYECKECRGKTVNPLDIERPPSVNNLAELLRNRINQYKRKRAYEDGRKLIKVTVRDKLPIGILHFGDPHVDDDGTDLELLQHHIGLINSTDGLYGANVGDTTNNWVGRLAKLYGEQGTSAAEAWLLAEWFITGVKKWLYIIGGNHDCFSGEGDPLKWITRQVDALYESSEVRLGLSFPQRKEPVIINARHDFPGHSQWNPAHGVMKAAQMGCRDDILVCGHKHTSGYAILKDPTTGRLQHCIQVASYKIFDRYARERGFRDQHISPSVLTVIDPQAEGVGLVNVFHDIDKGVEFLTYLRKRAAA